MEDVEGARLAGHRKLALGDLTLADVDPFLAFDALGKQLAAAGHERLERLVVAGDAPLGSARHGGQTDQVVAAGAKLDDLAVVVPAQHARSVPPVIGRGLDRCGELGRGVGRFGSCGRECQAREGESADGCCESSLPVLHCTPPVLFTHRDGGARAYRAPAARDSARRRGELTPVAAAGDGVGA